MVPDPHASCSLAWRGHEIRKRWAGVHQTQPYVSPFHPSDARRFGAVQRIHATLCVAAAESGAAHVPLGTAGGSLLCQLAVAILHPTPSRMCMQSVEFNWAAEWDTHKFGVGDEELARVLGEASTLTYSNTSKNVVYGC
jgi:hypothetical protein